MVERNLANEIVRLTNIKASANIRYTATHTRALSHTHTHSINQPTNVLCHAYPRWVDCLMCAGGELKIAMLLQNNTVETYSLKTTDKNPTGTKTSRLTLGGHRTDARTLAFSSDNIAILSASGDTVKVWNRWESQVTQD